MPVAKPSFFWEADCQLEIRNIAFSASYREVKEGNRTIRVFDPEWLRDGQIYWNASARLKGWLKQQAGTLRASARELVQYGMKVHSKDGAEWLTIAKPEELTGLSQSADNSYEYRLPDGIGVYPHLDRIKVREAGRVLSRFSFWYLLPNPKTVDFKVYCFARNISPDSVEDLLKKLGVITGLGDRHSSGLNGLFVLKHWEAKEERLNF